MRTGRLSISRGHQLDAKRFTPKPAPEPIVQPVSFKPSNDQGALHLVQVRLAALERLTRLVEQGALSVEEFKLEKSLILRLTAEELLLTEAAPAPEPPPAPRNPSLLGRLVNWRFLLAASFAGVGLSFAIQPEETLAYFSETALLLGF